MKILASLLLGVFFLSFGACDSNHPPVLLPIESPQIAYVNSRIDISILAEDVDGDSLSFSYIAEKDLGSRASIVTLSDRGVFSWTPAANDVGVHHIDFKVSDGTDSDTQTVRVEVKASTGPNQAPRFIRPLGYGVVLNLDENSCVKVDVRVEDPDSPSSAITIEQKPKISGSTFTLIGNLDAEFEWCPTVEQEQKNEYILGLVASDGESEPTIKDDFIIIIERGLPPTCPGDAPDITHEVPKTETTNNAIIIYAAIVDDKGLKKDPIILYSHEKPQDIKNVDTSTFFPIKMTKVAAGVYSASLPNPVAGKSEGTQGEIYYQIVAEDDDDAAGDCDHRTIAPAEKEVYVVSVIAPYQVATCGDSDDCSLGQVCDSGYCTEDGCTPLDANYDEFYYEQSNCPSYHFCPAIGPTISPSHCVEKCVDNSDCGTSGRKCKIFDTEGGCAIAGTKPVGDSCNSFEECEGRLSCLPWAGGYCTLSDCDSTGSFSGPCPYGTTCYPYPDMRFLYDETHWICAKNCFTHSDCRESEGYSCQKIQSDIGTIAYACLPN